MQILFNSIVSHMFLSLEGNKDMKKIDQRLRGKLIPRGTRNQRRVRNSRDDNDGNADHTTANGELLRFNAAIN